MVGYTRRFPNSIEVFGFDPGDRGVNIMHVAKTEAQRKWDWAMPSKQRSLKGQQFWAIRMFATSCQQTMSCLAIACVSQELQLIWLASRLGRNQGTGCANANGRWPQHDTRKHSRTPMFLDLFGNARDLWWQCSDHILTNVKNCPFWGLHIAKETTKPRHPEIKYFK